MHVGDAAVGRPGLGAVEHPFVGGLVVAGAGEDRADVGAGVRVPTNRTTPSLRIVGGAEHLRQPLARLFGRAVGGQRRRGQAGAQDRQPDAGVAPEHLLERPSSMPSPLGSAACSANNSIE